MMLKLVVIIFSFAFCCAQEHLTCLRTDDVLTSECPPTSSKSVQGPPGKRGPKGQIGSTGSTGQKGEEGLSGSKGQKGQMGSIGSKGHKGEPGIPDNRQIDLLQTQVDFLSQKMEALKNQTIKSFEVLADIASNVLFFPPNVYKLTPNGQSWQASREYCQNWGGDLAVHGVKTLENRLKLIENLSISGRFWIGVNDVASEGNWIWVNGEPASTSELIWNAGEPNNGGGRNQDCVSVYVNTSPHPDGKADDTECSTAFLGLCEKKILQFD